MAFHNVRLRDDIERGAKGGPRFKTNVLTLSSGKEKRNIEWAQARGEWDVGYGIQRKADYQEITAFFYSRRGRAHSFRFKDWSDFEMDRQEIGSGNGATSAFQIFKRYADDAGNYDRLIQKPVQGTVQVWVNGVLRTETTHYTVNYNTGVITFTGGNIPAMGHDVEALCEFDVAVRFDEDFLPTELQWEDAGSIPEIPIVEVRDE